MCTSLATGAGAAEACRRVSLPRRDGSITVARLIELYAVQRGGLDKTRQQRLSWWSAEVGNLALSALSDEDVHLSLEKLAASPSRVFAGRREDGTFIFRIRPRLMAPSTVNRYAAGLSAVITWAVRSRIAPQGYVHPCRSVSRTTENNERTRFLSDAEIASLLAACRRSTWPRLYLLTLMALTTGARRGELLALTWPDVDLERREARVLVTKNRDPRILPLVPAVVEELRRLRADAGLLFPSPGDPEQPYSIKGPFAKALRAARLEKVTFHTLRHSCASFLARNGATLLEISDLLGHRQLQMTKRYSHLATAHKAALVQRVLGHLR